MPAQNLLILGHCPKEPWAVDGSRSRDKYGKKKGGGGSPIPLTRGWHEYKTLG